MSDRFGQRLKAGMGDKHSSNILLLRPQMAKLPLPIQRYDDPFLPFSRAIIEAAQPLVCGVVFDMAAYLALGAAGAVAMERAIAFAGNRDLLTVLHAPFATPDYAAATSALAFAPDGVTVTDAALIPAYVLRHQSGVWVMGDAGADCEHSVFDVSLSSVKVVMPDHAPLILRVAGDGVVYSGTGEDFAEQTENALKRL
ncbi:MAG: hypothetical protein SF123_02645 [Chloroflexota bacterium]|nr:hypothetical protein [Chloroflexota bacterium]